MASHSSATAHEETPHTPFTNTLQKLVRRVDALKSEDSESKRVEALTEIICGADEEAAAALLVLMGTIENSTLSMICSPASARRTRSASHGSLISKP